MSVPSSAQPITIDETINYADATDSLVMSHQDSIRLWLKQMRPRSTIETIARVPGQVVYFPLKMTFQGLKYGISYVDDYDVIEKVDDALHSDDGLRAMIPTYSDQGGAGAKFTYKELVYPGSKLMTTTSWGLYGLQLYRVGVQRIAVLDNRVKLDGMLSYHLKPEEPFYGIGPCTNENDESYYTMENSSLKIGAGSRFFQDVDAAISLGLDNYHFFKGREQSHPPTPDTLEGSKGSVQIFGTSISLNYDTRDRKGNPRNGWEGNFSTGLYNQTNADKYAWMKFSIDATRYFHLFYDRTVALRAASHINTTLGSSSIPFFELSQLGQIETIRGFERGRFRDKSMLLGSAEYRWPIYQVKYTRVVDALLFVDTGTVAKSFGEVSIPNFQIGYGGGFRLYNEAEELVARLEFGFSKETVRMYLVLN